MSGMREMMGVLHNPDHGIHSAPSSMGPQNTLENFHPFAAGFGVPGMGNINGEWAPGMGMNHAAGGGPEATNSTARYHLQMSTYGHVAGDVGAEQLLFGFRQDPTIPVVAKVQMQCIKMKGLSRLNYYLKYSQEYREVFGRMNAKEFSERIVWLGVMSTKENALADVEVNSAEPVNWVVKGRVTLPNVFLANARAFISEGDQVYLLARKHKWMGNAVSDDRNWVKVQKHTPKSIAAPSSVPPPPPPVSLSLGANVAAGSGARAATVQAGVPHRSSPMHHFLTHTLGASGARERQGQQLHATREQWNNGNVKTGEEKDAGGEHYWTFHPYVCKLGENPPGPEMYRDGYRIHCGVVSHIVRGPNDPTPNQRRAAQAAVYPTTPGQEFMQQGLVPLDRVELMLRTLQPES